MRIRRIISLLCVVAIMLLGLPSGLRWDTSFSEDGDRSGPGWSEEMRPTGGFRLRHPLGLEQAIPLS